MKTNDILPENNHSGRTGYGTVTAIQAVETTLKHNKTKVNTTAVLTTNLSNAFNVVDHVLLLQKWKTL